MKIPCVYLVVLFCCCPSGAEEYPSGVFVERLPPLIVTDSKWTIALKIPFAGFLSDLQHIHDLAEDLRTSFTTHELARLHESFLAEYTNVGKSVTALLSVTKNLIHMFPHVRKPRGFVDIIGYGVHKAIGLATDDQIEELKESMKTLAGQNEDMSHDRKQFLTVLRVMEDQVRNNTSIVKATLQDLLDFRRNFTRHVESVVSQLEEELHAQLQYTLTSTHLRQVELALSDAAFVISNLHAAFLAANGGKLSPHFLPPGDFLDVLLEVESNLPPGMSLYTGPNNRTVSLFYQLAYVHASSAADTLYLYIDLLVHHVSAVMDVFAITLMPVYDANFDAWTEICLKNHIVLLTTNRTHFLGLSTAEFLSCTAKTSLYCLHPPIFSSANSTSCALDLVLDRPSPTCSLKVGKISSPHVLKRLNHGLVYSFSRSTKVRFYCPARNYTQSLDKTGFVDDCADCTVDSGWFFIHPTSTGRISRNRTVTPVISSPELVRSSFKSATDALRLYDRGDASAALTSLLNSSGTDSFVKVTDLLQKLEDDRTDSRHGLLLIANHSLTLVSFGVSAILAVCLCLCFCMYARSRLL